MASKVNKIVGVFTKTIAKLHAEGKRLDRDALYKTTQANTLLARAEESKAECERAKRIAMKLSGS